MFIYLSMGRYVSIVNFVGEIMVYTLDHFNGCVKTPVLVEVISLGTALY